MLTPYKMAYKPAPYNVSDLNYGANNQYKNFPPKMSDSRSLVSSSQPVSVTDYYLQNDQKSNWSYREYLKNNSDKIQNDMTIKSFNDVGYYQRFMKNVTDYPETTKPIVPYFFTSLFDNTRPIGYQNSDVKEIYLSREQLNARLMMPKIYDNSTQ
jgi:hypothetical protein